MELWMKIGYALLLGAMLFVLAPRAMHMFKHSPKAEAGDWQAFVLPMLAIAAFVALLMWLV